jgi:hypothetical protein
MVASELANMLRGNGPKQRDAQVCVSQAEADKILSVSARSVQAAAFVRDHGAPEQSMGRSVRAARCPGGPNGRSTGPNQAR